MVKVAVVGTDTVGSKKGNVVGYKIRSNEKDGAEGQEVVRTEADLLAFHKQLVKTQTEEQVRKADAVEAELNFPLGEYKTGLEWLMPAISLAAFGVAFSKNLGLAGSAGVATAFGSLAFLLVFSIGLARLPTTWSAPKRMKPIEEYLARCLRLEGKETENVIRALLEKPARRDWPSRMGQINLEVHDLPHATSQTEWWYYNSHVECFDEETKETRLLSLFICFFRILKHVDQRGKRYHSHALTWALSDVKNEKYYSDVILENDAAKSMLRSLDEEGSGLRDPILKRAFREILEKGNVPLPDRLFKVNPLLDEDKLELDYEGGTLVKDEHGRYVVTAKHYNLPCSFELVFTPEKQAVRHGDHGVVRGKEGDDMFYYVIPRMSVTGTVTVPKPHRRGGSVMDASQNPDSMKIVKGQGWYDHEFGGKPEEDWNYGDEARPQDTKLGKQAMTKYAWNWVAAQLDDNTEVTAALLVNTVDNSIMEVKAVCVDEQGNRTQYDGSEGVKFIASEDKKTRWTSVRTFLSYPMQYKLVVPGADLELTIQATFGDQECMTMIAKPAFWEGRCDVSGTRAGHNVTGLAYVERNGFSGELSIKNFFKDVGKVVRKSVQNMYPLHPTYEEGLELIATKETEHYMKGVPLEIIGDKLIGPVRMIADRGGKSWRSYGALACVDCVGGDSRDFVDWIAMPEFLHVGSLIIDDIQDESDTRRGGPAAHQKYGTALCINAGTAAYFQCEQMLKAPGLSPEDLNKCYALYFAALRGGHAGQALDINGLDYLMDELVETGDAKLAEERILAIHMLKTAVPAGTLARMGALVGKGTSEQVEAMGLYFESVGVAFQIMDDVLNLRGLYSKESDKLKIGTELKRLGEDIVDGKVTMPVCKAMGKISNKEERQKLWDIIRSKPHDQKIVDQVIQQLEDLGAIDDCVQQAEQVVEEAWAKLDNVIPDSFAKMMLRAFGSFVIERIQ